MYTTGPSSVNMDELAMGVGTIALLYCIVLAIAIFMLVCWVHIFRKAGIKGWYALCPYLNTYMQYKMVWGDGWKFLLGWIPFYNIYLSIKTVFGLGRAFGHGRGFGFGLLFLPVIFIPILAFGQSEYVGNPFEA